MKIEKVSARRIRFEKKVYPITLKESLLRMGLGFPIQVKMDENHCLYCVDGAKRLSAIDDILQDNPEHKLKEVSILLLDHARSASTQAKNHH